MDLALFWTPLSSSRARPVAPYNRGMIKRWRLLPRRGALLVSTDLHGNGEDFRRLRAIFESARARGEDLHWALLGDTVHGPSPEARAEQPELYDFPDESFAIVRGVRALAAQHPDRIHYVLGNHDHGHVGGPHTAKFHDDEVATLEATLKEDERAELRGLFRDALLALVAPCGVLLTHGSPDDTMRSLDELDRLPLELSRCGAAERRLLRTVLTSYGQQGEVTARLLRQISPPGLPLRVVLHGHDRDENGWFTEGDNQGCPVLFGALRAHKRYVLLDLGAAYASVHALRDGHEIRRLYG